MKFTYKKIFMKGTDNAYIEITNEEFERLKKADENFKNRQFISLHGALLEVDKSVRDDFYKTKDHEEYLQWRTDNREILYNSYDTDEMLGEEMLMDESVDVEECAEKLFMARKIRQFINDLPEKDRELIRALYFGGETERGYAKKKGMYRNAVHEKKVRILKKLKKFLEN